MHRPKHQEKRHINWPWIIIGSCSLVIISICSYFGIKLSQERSNADSNQITTPSKKIIVVNDDNSSNQDDSSQTSSSFSSSSSSTTNIGQFPDLKTASVCACLLVVPNWFKTNQIAFNQDDQTGYMKDQSGNFAEIQVNDNNSLTITLYPHGKKGQQRQVSTDELFNDYYNSPLKQSQVGNFVSRVN